jgi:hydrogenase-4 component F
MDYHGLMTIIHGLWQFRHFASVPIVLIAFSFILESRALRILVPTGLWLGQLPLVCLRLWPVIAGNVPQLKLGNDFTVDRLAGFFIILTTIVVASALTHAILYFGGETHGSPPLHERIFYVFASLFLMAMTFVFLCNNLGFLWICVEGTTLFSAPLVYFDRTKNAVEATWKYLIICSVGIAFALLGTIFIFASSQQASGQAATLQISDLVQNAATLNTTLLRLGFVFCLLGYGTKSGIFPLHNWLPDAHSEAPAPASAMLSGGLLNCALFAIFKVFSIVCANPSLARSMQQLVLVLGAITAVAASLLLIRQHSLKRMWAYSSIENVGIMLICIGFGSGGLFFLQAVNHSMAKVALFLLSGNVIQASGTKRLSGLHGLIESQPMWAVLLALAACSATGCPPFGTFASELKVLTATANAQNWPIGLVLLAAISVSFIAISSHLGRICCGQAKRNFKDSQPLGASVIPALLVLSSLALGLFLPPEYWTAMK